MFRWVVISWALLALVGADECPDGGRCEDGQTCCNDPASGYECCPFDQAECCEDHIHCCPADTVCETATSSCVNATVTIPWVERASADQPRLSKSFRMIKSYMGDDDDNICPDLSQCPAEFSCLKALTRFGCCPLAQGVSCSDGKHCCPEGHQCSADSRSCIKKDIVTTVICKDGVSECPDETTCCETPEGTWACCPIPNAVCCSDKIHCCPDGTTCDVEHSKCNSLSTDKVLPMWAKLPARMRADWENLKVVEQVTAGTVNDVGAEKVLEVTTANGVPPSEEEVSTSSVTKAAAGNDVPCNQTAACPDGTTCCKTKEGEWACCPLPEAVCCEDFVHCCPKGKKCNVAEQTCEDDTCSVPWAEKVPTIPRSDVQVKDVPCDDTVGCPDGTTCCKTKEGGWACCPLPEAVCCEDFEHCCPKGKKCNLTAQTCDDGTRSVPWTEKVPSIPQQIVQVKVVPCDDTASCPDGSTCCKTKEGKWACCPLPEAVCCDDHEHCCPAGTTCDSTSLSCQGPSASVPMKQKVPAFSTAAPTTASQAQVTEQEDEKEEPVEENKEIEGKIQCDPRTSCPQSSTCCFVVASRQWGCCPLPQAVCCADGSHCCPQNYKCNEQATSCVKGEVEIPWYTKLPALTSDQSDLSAVQCDGGTQCPEHTTCCKLATGEWGCCPLENAVCCSDKKHCCPQDFICNEASNSCQRLITLEVEMVPLTPVYLPDQPLPSPLTHGDIPCDEKTRCKDGQTCCRTSTTTWGCCPSPNAVCCSDMRHCCPNGSSCTEEGSCIEDPFLYWSNWHVFLANKKRGLLL
ncbi:granulin a isoform X12 [Acanthochromis polyacanthus]|uniref:granulin a isoform X12 n=1 Tax=Acanthochromis polyacanthus TaxID=80966 RepID=UPI0022348379|nr:granulin a isoform X12 [Acanthochromis polyacanthus]